MAKQRIINTKFWNDNFIVELDPLERYLFIYLLTNEHTNICGIYELPLRVMAFESGLDKEMLNKMLPRLAEKINYLDGWVCIRNFMKHQATSSMKVQTGIEVELQKIPLEILDKLIEYRYPINRVSNHIIYSNTNSNTNSNTKVVKFDKEDMELSCLLYDLIKINIPTYKEPNLEKWADQIRLMKENDKRTPEQIKFVIKWAQNNDFWQANILSTKKLREKFDTLVAQIKRDSKSKKWHILS